MQTFFRKIFSFFILALPVLGFCNDVSSFVWKARYYHAIPKHHTISSRYCKQRELGSFTGVVNQQLKDGAVTNRHITLSHFTFKQKVKGGIHFLQGSLLATGIIAGKKWQEHVHYYLYKLTDDGITRGVWSSEHCKGLYVGDVTIIGDKFGSHDKLPFM